MVTSVGDIVCDESERYDLWAALHLTSEQGRWQLWRATETHINVCVHWNNDERNLPRVYRKGNVVGGARHALFIRKKILRNINDDVRVLKKSGFCRVGSLVKWRETRLNGVWREVFMSLGKWSEDFGEMLLHQFLKLRHSLLYSMRNCY
jgi:hypothetical protein